MFIEQKQTNKLESFKHFVKRNKQNPDTVFIDEQGYYCYRTKRGLLKTFVSFDTFNEYKKSDFYPEHAEKVNGFYFVSLV